MINDSFESMFKQLMNPGWFESEAGSFDLRLDLSERNGSYFVTADIPGAKKEDIHVVIDGNVIQIEAEIKGAHEMKGGTKGSTSVKPNIEDANEKILRSERYVGHISRSFTVAHDIEDSRAVARYEDGVLSLELPKKPSTSSRVLQIH